LTPLKDDWCFHGWAYGSRKGCPRSKETTIRGVMREMNPLEAVGEDAVGDSRSGSWIIALEKEERPKKPFTFT